MTLLYTDPLFLQHDTGRGHPETAARLRAIAADPAFQALASRCRPGVVRALPEEDLTAVHAVGQVAYAREACQRGGGQIEADTVVSPESYDVARAAAGSAAAAVDAVLAGEDRTAFCLVRPPGHH